MLYRTVGLEPEVEQQLLGLVSDDLPGTLPDFPSRQQLADRPVRFRVMPDTSEEFTLICRSIEAGLDHTRRPGNVFTQGAVVTRTGASRAMDYWFSPSWLSPFGAEQVRLAVPADELLLPEGFGFESVAARVRNDHDLLAALPWMIDALVYCVYMGLPVALVDPRPDRCAAWLGLLSWAIEERSASNLAFAVYEDRRSAQAMADHGAFVFGVADHATAAGLGSPVVTLDPSWEPDDTQAAITGLWTLPSGMSIPKTDWARLMVDLVWAPPERARRALEVREGLAQGLRRLEALPRTSEGQLATLHLAYLSEAEPGEVSEQIVRGALAMLPPGALAHPLVRKLASDAGMGNDGGGNVQPLPTVTLSARPAPSMSGPPEYTQAVERPREPALVTADPLDEFPFPTPRSAAIAASVLASAGLTLTTVGDGAACVEAFSSADDSLRLALVHAAAHLVSQPLERASLERLVAAVEPGGSFERLAPGLLILACRSQLADPPDTAPQGGAWPALRDYVGQCDAEDLAYLGFHFGPVLEGLEHGVVASRPGLESLASLGNQSVWTMTNRLGVTLVSMVLDEIHATQHERVSVGRRGLQ